MLGQDVRAERKEQKNQIETGQRSIGKCPRWTAKSKVQPI